MPFMPIVGTLAYVWDRESDRVLLVHRIARDHDDHYGKYNGLGGKLEPDESAVEGLRRELAEEAAIELTSVTLRGTITWTGFGPKGEDWLVFVFRVDGWTGEPPESNPEGRLEWQPRAALLGGELPMWDGDRHFLPLVFDDDERQFHGAMPYDGDRPLSWTYERI